MIPGFGRSEVVIIYPDSLIQRQEKNAKRKKNMQTYQVIPNNREYHGKASLDA
jgi:hypothetical protein